MLLSKGFEVEVFTATPQGDVVGFADRIVANLHGFVREPDKRNVEYTTDPFTQYDRLLIALLEPRRQLRNYLRSLGNYTIMPGSTLSLGGSEKFERSDPQNPYHGYIENTYGTKVVTASIHINVGIPDLEELIRACRLVRLESALYLALSASSPFLQGGPTGSHSTRWQMFPKTPTDVPIFTGHHHFVTWTEAQLQLGTMQNVRHLWSSVRPNGDHRPYDLNRLELRICDLVFDPVALLAITALLEVRLLQMLADPQLDPLQSRFSPSELVAIAEQNETQAAKESLDAQLVDWQTGRTLTARDWIREQYERGQAIAKERGIACYLTPLLKILNEGNEAQKWLSICGRGLSPRQILTDAIQAAAGYEAELSKTILYDPISA